MPIPANTTPSDPAPDPMFDVKLARRLADNYRAGVVNLDATLRILNMLSGSADNTRIAPFLVQLLRNAHPHLTSKLALLLGKSGDGAKWAERMFAARDPRVHANLIEALWGTDSPEAREILWAMASALDRRTAANALVGLYKIAEPASVPMIVEMSKHDSAEFRASAACAMGETGDAAFHPSLAKMITDADPAVRRNALRALARIREHASRLADEARPRTDQEESGAGA
jgi:HEAT repeat protein